MRLTLLKILASPPPAIGRNGIDADGTESVEDPCDVPPPAIVCRWPTAGDGLRLIARCDSRRADAWQSGECEQARTAAQARYLQFPQQGDGHWGLTWVRDVTRRITLESRLSVAHRSQVPRTA